MINILFTYFYSLYVNHCESQSWNTPNLTHHEDNAGQHETAGDAHQPLSPPIHHLVRVVAALDGSQDAVVVEEVDVDVGSSQSHEHLDVVATFKKQPRKPTWMHGPLFGFLQNYTYLNIHISAHIYILYHHSSLNLPSFPQSSLFWSPHLSIFFNVHLGRRRSAPQSSRPASDLHSATDRRPGIPAASPP